MDDQQTNTIGEPARVVGLEKTRGGNERWVRIFDLGFETI